MTYALCLKTASARVTTYQFHAETLQGCLVARPRVRFPAVRNNVEQVLGVRAIAVGAREDALLDLPQCSTKISGPRAETIGPDQWPPS